MHDKLEGQDLDLLCDKGTIFKVELLDPSKLEADNVNPQLRALDAGTEDRSAPNEPKVG